MKKIILSLVFAGASVYSFAQEFAIGIKGGPNFAKIDTESSPGENYENRTGFHAGAFALFKFGKVGIQPELLYSQQGSTLKYSGDPDLKSNFSYMNIPVILKLYTVAGINLQAGPQFGFLTSAKTETLDGSGKVTEQDIKSDLKGSDFSIALGVGWDLPFGLTVDGRYNLGLSDINDATAQSVKNQVWQFSVGYKIFKGGNSKK